MDPNSLLSSCARDYPQAWAQIAMFRSKRGREGFPRWPDYVYVPMAGSYAVVSGGSETPLKAQAAVDISRVCALSSWRMTRGIYRFDRTLFDQVWETPVEGRIPIDVLYRLPEWCVYIETPGKSFPGFFTHLEWVPDTAVEELRLLLNLGDTLYPIALHLTGGDIVSALDASLAESNFQLSRHGGSPVQIDHSHVREFARTISPLVSLVLYLCAVNGKIRDAKGTERQPKNPGATKIKGGKKMFAASGATTWEVGYRMGAALRAAEAREPSESQGGTHSKPRPHVRRAHWHAYWTGIKTAPQKSVIKWLSPILVGVEDAESLPGVIRPVT
jgi:hypothetical protein